MLVVQDHIGGVAQAPSQVDQGAMSELMDLEDTIIDVGDAIDVILEDINAEGVTQAWGEVRGDLDLSHTLLSLGPKALGDLKLNTSCSHHPSTYSSHWQQVPSASELWGQERLLLPLPTCAKFPLSPMSPPRSSIPIGKMNECKGGPEGQGRLRPAGLVLGVTGWEGPKRHCRTAEGQVRRMAGTR